MSPPLIVIGAPGAGKSTVGRGVADRLDLPFADSDDRIEQDAGCSVADIFVRDGEDAFRSLEKKVVTELLSCEDGIVSLGGGSVLDPDTRRALGGRSVVWLRVDIATAAQRIGLSATRPLLVGNVRGTLARLLSEREPLYKEVATFEVDTCGKSVPGVIDEVCAHLDTMPSQS